MGIGGHILGPKKLRRLSRLTNLDLRRAYIRNGEAEGTVWEDDGSHKHYAINPKTGETRWIPNPMHWGSCEYFGNDPSL